MLNQRDFVKILGELRKQLLKTMNNMDYLVDRLDDTDLCYKFVALKQMKKHHLEAMNAIASKVVAESMQ